MSERLHQHATILCCDSTHTYLGLVLQMLLPVFHLLPIRLLQPFLCAPPVNKQQQQPKASENIVPNEPCYVRIHTRTLNEANLRKHTQPARHHKQHRVHEGEARTLTSSSTRRSNAASCWRRAVDSRLMMAETLSSKLGSLADTSALTHPRTHTVSYMS